MNKKFFIRGYRRDNDLPFLYDDDLYSFEEARAKAKVYFDDIGLLGKVIICQLGDRGKKNTIELLYRDNAGTLGKAREMRGIKGRINIWQKLRF